MKHNIYGLLMLTLACGCGRSESVREKSPSEPPPQFSLQNLSGVENQKWREKVIERLWYKKRVDIEEKNVLMALDNEAFLEKITNDPRFTETILDFNVYFLGFHSSSMRYPDGGIDTIFNPNGPIDSYYSYTPAVFAAKEFAMEGDYFSLFSMPKKVYLAPLRFEDFDPNQDPKEFVKERNASIVKMRKHFAAIAAMDDADTPIKIKDVCEDNFIKFSPEPFNLGFPFHLLFTLNGNSPVADFSTYELCNKEEKTEQEEHDNKIIPKDQIAKLRKTHEYWEEKILKLADSLLPENYLVKSVNDIKELSLKDYERKDQPIAEPQTNTWFFSSLTNSSTNMNRKRAAYILKQYFCDDLTPVNVVIPEDHTEDAHGSTASCYSCHYKLDPMAGFFRNRGIGGFDFGQAEDIRFDDNAKVSREDYFKNWQRKDGTWNVGYVRSPEDVSLNTYPENNDLAGLFELIKNSDEPKRCLVEKAFKYFLGEKVTVDGEFQNLYAEKFLQNSKTSSVDGMKSLVKDIVRTNSFVTESPVKGECYDLPEGVDLANRPPCSINFIIQKNCANCHGEMSKLGGLDMTTWSPTSGFKHDNANLSHLDVLQRIEERLTTSDKNIRMPLRKHIDSTELQDLIHWISQQKIQTAKGELQ